MSVNKVVLSEIDGALAILPSGGRRAVAIVGPAGAGAFNLPAAFGDPKSLINYFSRGLMPQVSAHNLQKYGTIALCCRASQSTAATFTTVVHTGAGTSVVTSTGSNCDDDYEPWLLVTKPGTIGVTGIEIQWSLDGGRTKSPITGLGVATSFVIPNSGGVTFAFAAGTMLLNQTESFRTTGPVWNNTDLATAIQAVENSSIDWELLIVCGALTPTAAAVVDANIDPKRHAWIGGVRVPNIAEDDPTYAAAMATAWNPYMNGGIGEVCAAACEVISAIDGRSYMRSPYFVIGPKEASVDAAIDIAEIDQGGVPAIITDDAGNPKYHDEFVTPSLSAARFSVLRTYDREVAQGVYPNNPYVMSSAGSDYDIMPKRRVMNIAHRVAKRYLSKRLAKRMKVDKRTGYLKESDRREVEGGFTQSLRAALGNRVSDTYAVVNKTDNLLQKQPITGSYRLIPLVYPEEADFSAGFENPALNISPV